MGTINIEEYAKAGTNRNADTPVADLSNLLATTIDATTSSSAESITLNDKTNLVTIYAVEDHRVSITDSTVSTTYSIVPAGTVKDYGVPEGGTLYYRTDA